MYENVILVEASDGEQAWIKARAHAKASMVKDDSLTLNGEPAVEALVGIRKIIEVSNRWPLSQSGDRPLDGTEITYSQFEGRTNVPYPSLPMVKRRSFAIWSSEFHCEITILGAIH